MHHNKAIVYHDSVAIGPTLLTLPAILRTAVRFVTAFGGACSERSVVGISCSKKKEFNFSKKGAKEFNFSKKKAQKSLISQKRRRKGV